ncbi:MAG: hypothetical protein HYW01_04520 [Deltaproteobacteria bacterium]|nr:hypothetical protein [Deltaproteobacteria bacterium]
MSNESSYIFLSEGIMRMAVRRIVIALAALIWSFSASLTFAQNPEPTAMYLEFVAATQRATAFDQIAPYFTTEFRKELEVQPKDMVAEWFKYFKSMVDLTDIKITKETISGDSCVLEATAKNSGRPSKGKISLFRENGVWKFDDGAWATQM